MKRILLNIYNLHKETLYWKKCEKKRIIIKYLLKSKYSSKLNKTAYKLKSSDIHKNKSISFQTNVCKITGNYKRTFDRIGFNRHALKQYLNVNALPNIKKLSW